MTIEQSNTYFLGYRIFIDDGVIIKPRWWEILRRLGLRKKRHTYTVPKGNVLLSKQNYFMTVRREDMDDLFNHPDFPRPEPIGSSLR